MIDHYDWPGGREAMLRFGPDTGPVVVMLLPLFEEHNRTRAFAVTICRALAAMSVASLVPDLPGQGESVLATQSATLADWRNAVKSLSEAQGAVRPVFMASMRGGAVADSVAGVCGVWRLSPITGYAVLADLQRAQSIGGEPNLSMSGPDSPPVNLVGNLIGWPLFNELLNDDVLREALAPLRTVRLESDPAPADIKFPGAPLWRRAEPGNDGALAQLLAADIADWVLACGG